MNVFLESSGDVVVVEKDNFFRSGGEASLYKLRGCEDVLMKIYHSVTAELAAKCEAMVANPPIAKSFGGGYAGLTWPRGCVYSADTARRFLGIEIPFVARGQPLHSLWQGTLLSSSTGYRDLLLTARNLAWAVAAVHDAGHVIGDLHPANVLVANTMVTLIDTDSFQITTQDRVFPSVYCREEYTAPELIGVDLGSVRRTDHHDLWALGVLCFQLLMGGNHPFTACYTGSSARASQTDRIKQGIWVYADVPPKDYSTSPLVQPMNTLNKEIRMLFRRCFEHGHSDPAQRPTGAEWRTVLTDAAADSRYVARTEKSRRGHAAKLHKVGLDVTPGIVGKLRRWALRLFRFRKISKRGVVAAVAIVLIIVSCVFTMRHSLADRTLPHEPHAEQPIVRTPNVQASTVQTPIVRQPTCSAEEYAKGKPTPGLWTTLAEE